MYQIDKGDDNVSIWMSCQAGCGYRDTSDYDWYVCTECKRRICFTCAAKEHFCSDCKFGTLESLIKHD